MAFPTAVNSQITDSVTQSNLEVLGDSPAMGIGNLYIATSQALSNAAHNATTSQNEAGVVSRAAMTQSVAALLILDTAATGKTAQQILGVSGQAGYY